MLLVLEVNHLIAPIIDGRMFLSILKRKIYHTTCQTVPVNLLK